MTTPLIYVFDRNGLLVSGPYRDRADAEAYRRDTGIRNLYAGTTAQWKNAHPGKACSV